MPGLTQGALKRNSTMAKTLPTSPISSILSNNDLSPVLAKDLVRQRGSVGTTPTNEMATKQSSKTELFQNIFRKTQYKQQVLKQSWMSHDLEQRKIPTIYNRRNKNKLEDDILKRVLESKLEYNCDNQVIASSRPSRISQEKVSKPLKLDKLDSGRADIRNLKKSSAGQHDFEEMLQSRKSILTMFDLKS